MIIILILGLLYTILTDRLAFTLPSLVLRNRIICALTLAIAITVRDELLRSSIGYALLSPINLERHYGNSRSDPIGRIARTRIAVIGDHYAHLRGWWLITLFLLSN